MIADEATIKAYEEITVKRSTALEKLKKLQETYDKYTVTKPNPAEKFQLKKLSSKWTVK